MYLHKNVNKRLKNNKFKIKIEMLNFKSNQSSKKKCILNLNFIIYVFYSFINSSSYNIWYNKHDLKTLV